MTDKQTHGMAKCIKWPIGKLHKNERMAYLLQHQLLEPIFQ